MYGAGGVCKTIPRRRIYGLVGGADRWREPYVNACKNPLVYFSGELEAEYKRPLRRVGARGEHETNRALRIPELACAIRPVLDMVRRAVMHVFLPGMNPCRNIALFCPCPTARTPLDGHFRARPEDNANRLY